LDYFFGVSFNEAARVERIFLRGIMGPKFLHRIFDFFGFGKILGRGEIGERRGMGKGRVREGRGREGEGGRGRGRVREGRGKEAEEGEGSGKGGGKRQRKGKGMEEGEGRRGKGKGKEEKGEGKGEGEGGRRKEVHTQATAGEFFLWLVCRHGTVLQLMVGSNPPFRSRSFQIPFGLLPASLQLPHPRRFPPASLPLSSSFHILPSKSYPCRLPPASLQLSRVSTSLQIPSSLPPLSSSFSLPPKGVVA
jgi:hypothetical protein